MSGRPEGAIEKTAPKRRALKGAARAYGCRLQALGNPHTSAELE